MTGTRLFVGGLSLELEESVLSEHFSNYGTITKLDIKDKKDLVTGEVIKRFAFATLDASSSSIDQCIKALHGKVLSGSAITVERAQESFIDRLKREREERNKEATAPVLPDDLSFATEKPVFQHNRYADSYNYNNNREDYSERNSSFNRNEGDYSERNSSFDRNRHDYSERSNSFNKSEQDKIPLSGSDLLPTLTSHDAAAWGDSDPENEADDGSKHVHAEQECRRPEVDSAVRKPKTIERYDPTKAKPPTAADVKPAAISRQQKVAVGETKILSGLSFTGASAGFSLLSLMQQRNSETESVVSKDTTDESEVAVVVEKEEATEANEEETPKDEQQEPMQISPVKPHTILEPYNKTYKFFVDEGDAEVEENLRWVYKEITQSQISKFQEERLEIIKLYTYRDRRATEESRKELHTRDSQGHWDEENKDYVESSPQKSGATLATDNMKTVTQCVVPTGNTAMDAVTYRKDKNNRRRAEFGGGRSRGGRGGIYRGGRGGRDGGGGVKRRRS